VGIIKVSLGQKIIDGDMQFQLLFHLLCPSSSVTAARKENYQTWNCSSPVKALIPPALLQSLGVITAVCKQPGKGKRIKYSPPKPTPNEAMYLYFSFKDIIKTRGGKAIHCKP